MRVFKFGGASVKNAEGVKNLVKVLSEMGHDNTILVVSAMGKTTNAMEAIINAYFKDGEDIIFALQETIDYHNEILEKLFENSNHPIFGKVKSLLKKSRVFF